MRTQIRWSIRRDMPSMLEIDAASFADAWGEERFLAMLRSRNVIGMVAERGEVVVGFMVYAMYPKAIAVLRFAVHPEHRRTGVGTAMHAKLASKLSPLRRTRVSALVRESDLDALWFWKRMGYRAAEVVRGHYADTGEDGYRMDYNLDDAEPEAIGPTAFRGARRF